MIELILNCAFYICRQQIRLKHTSELVLLCSNYCIQPPMDRTETETSCRLSDAVSRDCHDIAKVIRGVWKCPCVSGQL